MPMALIKQKEIDKTDAFFCSFDCPLELRRTKKPANRFNLIRHRFRPAALTREPSSAEDILPSAALFLLEAAPAVLWMGTLSRRSSGCFSLSSEVASISRVQLLSTCASYSSNVAVRELRRGVNKETVRTC